MVRRDAYRKTGGHAQIRATMHDGLLLPQLFRRHGLRTDIADLTHLATCRMYHNASEVWQGLAKNATEGMASPARILPFTFLLFCGQILPFLLAVPLLFHGPPGQVAPGGTATSDNRSSSPPWQRLLYPACFPSGNTANPWPAPACIRWALLCCSRFSGMPCCAKLRVNVSPGKSGRTGWGKSW